METVSIDQAQINLSGLLSRVELGEAVEDYCLNKAMKLLILLCLIEGWL